MKNKKTGRKQNKSAYALLEFDAQRYASYVKELNLSEEEERQLLKALFDIMMAFLEMGYGIHPVQDLGFHEAQKDKEKSGVAVRSVLYSHGFQNDILDEQAPQETALLTKESRHAAKK